MTFCEIPIKQDDKRVIQIKNEVLNYLYEYLYVKDLNKIIYDYVLSYDICNLEIIDAYGNPFIILSNPLIIKAKNCYYVKIDAEKNINLDILYTFKFSFFWFHNLFTIIEFKETHFRSIIFREYFFRKGEYQIDTYNTRSFNLYCGLTRYSLDTLINEYMDKTIVYNCSKTLNIISIYFCKSFFEKKD